MLWMSCSNCWKLMPGSLVHHLCEPMTDLFFCQWYGENDFSSVLPLIYSWEKHHLISIDIVQVVVISNRSKTEAESRWYTTNVSSCKSDCLVFLPWKLQLIKVNSTVINFVDRYILRHGNRKIYLCNLRPSLNSSPFMLYRSLCLVKQRVQLISN